MKLREVVLACSAAGMMALAGACAREGSPPGGPPDRRPPVLVKTEPDTFADVPNFKGPVRFMFDERISEKVASGTLDDAVLVSPRTGTVRVSHDRQGVSVSLSGGFRPGLTYRVTLLPVLSDLFNNRMSDPVDLVFSTGGGFDNTAVAGLVWNRITGDGLAQASVDLTSDSDSLVYTAETDSAGFYAFRYVPAGRYTMVAFQDQNRNERPDVSELQGRRQVAIGPSDTLIVNESTLRPDSTPAQLTRASALDSVTVVLQFDDYLDPDMPMSDVAVRLTRPDGTPGPGPARLLQEAGYNAYVDQVQDSFARIDSIQRVREAVVADSLAAANAARADTAAARDTSSVRPDTTGTRDTLRALRDTMVARDTLPARGGGARGAQAAPSHPIPPRLPGAAGARGRSAGRGARQAQDVGPEGNPLPARRIVALLDRPLTPADSYTVTVAGVTNVNGLPGGGGTDTLVAPLPDTTKADSVGAPAAKADSAAADTLHAGHAGSGRRPARLEWPDLRRRPPGR